MASNEFDLHPDRLATTDASGGRIFLYPADVKGFFRRQRTRVQFILIFLFLVLPWIRIQGRQALLLDIAERRFEIFGLSLRSHNAPLLIFVAAAGAFGLFFATAIWGRVWCGWACPQTVFIDGVFRRIEQWVEGSARERRKLDSAAWGSRKVLKRFTKWSLYIGATLVLTHSVLAYFVGTEKLAEMIQRPPGENWGSFLFMLIASGIILFDFAWFREQFCTIACPYGRFQSVLMDKTSLVVAYDVPRGEPRATIEARALAKTGNITLGDCVNCYRCVQVCPTGIDIRRGQQLECIACTACIDACDAVMKKFEKPVGLIRYDSAAPRKKGHLSFRAGLYLALCLFSIIALVISLALIRPVDVQVLRAKDSPYTLQTLENGTIVVINHFVLELSNQSGAPHDLTFSTEKGDENHDVQVITAQQPLPLADGKIVRTDVFIRLPKSLLENGQKKIELIIKDKNSKTNQVLEIEKEITLVGPFL